MKLILRWAVPAILALAAAPWGWAASYTITNAPGWNLIANHFDNRSGNAIRFVMPPVPVGSRLIRFNLATKAFDTIETYQMQPTGALAWAPGTNILDPGDGLYFLNSSKETVVLTISGNPHVPVLPLKIGTGPVLVASQTNAPATVADILGYSPPNFTAVYRFVPGANHDPDVFAPPHYTIYAMKGGAWITPPGAPPSFRVGESVWITTNGSVPSITRQPVSVSVCPGSKASFAAGASGTPPLSYQWLRNGTALRNATNASYEISPVQPSDSGNYTLQVSNPFGSVTSAAATLTASDTEPPVLTCPKDIVTECRGEGGTHVEFGVGINDNCDPQPVVVAVPPPGSLFPAGVTTVVCTGLDASGNTNACTFTVTVVDKEPPQISCPADKVVVATSSEGARVFYSPSATDNCDLNLTIECDPPSGSLFPLGETAVVCVAKDSDGNRSVCRFNVTVVDQSCCKDKSWKGADTDGPNPRFGHSMAYDSARGRVVLFGGNGPNGAMADTWEWDGSAWAQIPAEGPGPRAFAAMDYDSRIGLVVMYGGRGGTAGVLGDTWLWDGAKWQRSDAKPPGPRYGHAMAYDNVRQVTVLYGGVSADGTELDDTWEFDGVQWLSVAKGPPGPGPRQGHAMAYGSAQRQMLLFGGQTKDEVFDDTWQWDGKGWNEIAKGGPPPRAYHAMAYNDNCDSVVMFGGGAKSDFSLSDTWEWDGRGWSLTATKLPTNRGQLAMAHDSDRGQTVLFGGTRTTKDWLGDTWLYGNDRTPPDVVSVDVACGDRIAVVTFDKPVSALSATSTNHYAVICGQTIMPVLQAVLTDDPRIVWLYTSEPISGGCILSITGVQDLCGLPLRSFRMPFECRQDPCIRGSAGREFWLTFPGNYAPDPTNQPQPQVFVAGLPGTVGAVIVPGLAPPFATFFSIPAGGVATIPLPRSTDLGDANDQIQTNAVHILASRPVAVYGLNHVKFTTDAFLGLSTRAIGKTYIVMAYRNLFAGVPELNGSQFAIAAGLDNTTVVVVPSASVGSHPAGVPFVVPLMRGQTYQLRCTNDAPADLTGSIIVADKPISVFGGHQCAAVPNSSMMFCDYLVEQLPPTEMWGYNFITVPLATRSNGDTFRVLALLNNTTVSVNGVALPGSLNQGQVYEIQLSSASRISADKPVLTTQFANSSDYDINPNSDPLMVVLQPTSLYSAGYIIESPAAGFSANYLNLMVPNASVSQVVLDGVTLPASSFSAIGASGFSGGSVPVAPGPHLVFISGGAEFGAVAYGWSSFDAYGYSGATCGAEQSKPPRFECPPEKLSIEAGTGCVGVVPDLSKLVGNAQFAILITQEPPAGTLLSPGTYTIKTIVIDPFGQREICTTVLTVTPGSGIGLQCPPDILTNCAPGGGQTIFYEVGLCNTNYTVTGSPASGSLFPNGVNKVVVTATSPDGVNETCTFTVTVKCDTTPATVGISQVGGTNLTLNWNGGGTLQQASTLPGPWITVSNAVSPFRARIVGAQGYFRVVQ